MAKRRTLQEEVRRFIERGLASRQGGLTVQKTQDLPSSFLN
jgi:hypothetical protein